MTELIKRETLFGVALLALILAVFYLFYRVMVPFFAPIAWGAVLVITFRPLHLWISRRIHRKAVAASMTTAILTLLIVGPVAYLATALVGEAGALYSFIQERLGEDGASWQDIVGHPIIGRVTAWLERTFGISQTDLQSSLVKTLSSISRYIVQSTTSFVANIGNAGFKFILMLLTAYYLFKDGDTLVGWISESIPLPDERAAAMLHHIAEVVRATMYGGLAVGLLQGFLGGLLFWILGLHSPVFWGAVMGFLSLIPLLGAFLIYIPAAIGLILGGAVIKGVILLILGTVVVSQIDNILRPILISGRTRLHPLLLFFSIAGGLAVFGILGLVVGPVIAAVFVAMFELYRFALRPGADPGMPAKAPQQEPTPA